RVKDPGGQGGVHHHRLGTAGPGGLGPTGGGSLDQAPPHGLGQGLRQDQVQVAHGPPGQAPLQQGGVTLLQVQGVQAGQGDPSQGGGGVQPDQSLVALVGASSILSGGRPNLGLCSQGGQRSPNSELREGHGAMVSAAPARVLKMSREGATGRRFALLTLAAITMVACGGGGSLVPS